MAKPLLFPEDYNTSKFDPRSRTASDPSRIPGYSEIVKANDIDRADDLEFRNAHKDSKDIKRKEDVYAKIGSKPSQLPVEFAWLRVNGPGGANSPTANAEVDSYMADQGFIPCTKDRFDALCAEYGYSFNSAAWRVAEDGTIRRGYDVALFYRRGDVAEMWNKALADEAARREGASFPHELSADKATAETYREEEVEEIVISH